MVSPLDQAVCEVLRRYPIIRPDQRLIGFGNRGGFSGARLWRLQESSGSYCVRAWPPGEPAPERLSWIHQLMQRARKAGLDFVPAVVATNEGTTWAQHAGRLWDVTTWMAGQADFHHDPTISRVEAACTALAQLHNVWRDLSSAVGPCPGIARRLAIAREWMEWIRSGWSLPLEADAGDAIRPWAEPAWSLLRAWVGTVPQRLEPWTEHALPLQPCLCDIWHDHVLFEADTVTGVIDYGGVRVDHVAVDLARLLGSMVGDNSQQRCAGLGAYERIRPLSWKEEGLVGVLDETGVIIAVATWLKWLYRENKEFEDRAGAAHHLSTLVQRMETWNRPSSI
jgi:Ser/Thr protein kinase RdoA (MazF antagonist)